MLKGGKKLSLTAKYRCPPRSMFSPSLFLSAWSVIYAILYWHTPSRKMYFDENKLQCYPYENLPSPKPSTQYKNNNITHSPVISAAPQLSPFIFLSKKLSFVIKLIKNRSLWFTSKNSSARNCHLQKLILIS